MIWTIFSAVFVLLYALVIIPMQVRTMNRSTTSTGKGFAIFWLVVLAGIMFWNVYMVAVAVV